MRAVVQRVKNSSVTVDEEVIGEIGEGLLIFLGIGKEDMQEDADYLLDKIMNLRIFADEEGKMNLSALDLEKEVMIISQFTLFGDCRKGRRPSFFSAASPEKAETLYEYFVQKAQNYELKIATGEFQAMMDIELCNDGPVTMLIDSKKKF
ncbi:MAG: D-aminoacyl-tRNA deacylase [Halanaerobiales bacterium]